jgi:DNA-binding beta-propeller fold protein YncE
VWVVGYGSNEIVKIDVNGIVRDRKRGPVNGFDRPYDMVRGVDGRLYVSEFRGGRVSVLNSNGDFQKYIGEKGLKAGQFSGPQNLTIDDSGYLYVVDFGNKRIAKYDPDGKFIVAFGQRSGQFQGLQSPTGIAARNNKIYAADSIAKTISVFDHNGNFLNQIAVEGLISPESLRFLSTGSLIVVDSNRILLVDPETAIARVLGIVGNEKMRLTCADMDSNGSILAVNFTVGEVSVMTRFDDLASGLFVQIRNVNAEKFPSVTVEFTVEDRQRRPIIGLDTNNFLLTENGNKASDQLFLSPGHKYSGSDIAFVVERSERTAGMRDELTALSRDVNRIIKDMKNTKIISLVSAGVQPRREQHDRSLENSMRGYESSYNPAWRFDLGLRLAATDLLTAASKRSVIYIGSGNLGDKAFEQYSLSELAGYLANNGIVFNAIIIGNAQISPGLDYLCVQTGGKAMRLFRPQGVAELFNNTTTIPSPLYTFTYTSKLPTDFGRSWLPVEIEAHLLERSGRDSTGYFPPLQ